jgi:hypothetical protein
VRDYPFSLPSVRRCPSDGVLCRNLAPRGAACRSSAEWGCPTAGSASAPASGELPLPGSRSVAIPVVSGPKRSKASVRERGRAAAARLERLPGYCGSLRQIDNVRSPPLTRTPVRDTVDRCPKPMITCRSATAPQSDMAQGGPPMITSRSATAPQSDMGGAVRP